MLLGVLKRIHKYMLTSTMNYYEFVIVITAAEFISAVLFK